jgi:D-beta-D-heptose 7-phosphate kinase/D-beta-D-heptose 1-phosphate adenosyltransferase
MILSSSLIDAFSSLRVLVVGDAMLDVYLRGQSSRLCQEAPVPIIDYEDRVEAPGGAANTALNLAALGARVSLLSVVGRDRDGRRLCEALTRQGVDTRHVIAHPRRRTLAKQRILSSSQLIARVDQGDRGPLSAPDEFAIASRLHRLLAKCDAVVLSDYGYGMLNPEVIAALCDAQRHYRPVVVGDSKQLKRFTGVQFTAVKPNYSQAIELLGLKPLCGTERREQVRRLGPQIFNEIDTRILALTLDQDGAFVFERDKEPHRTHTRPNPHSQAAGAGDTYVAALTLALAAGGDTAAAAEMAAAAAAVVVAKDGTACCTWQELQNQLSGREQPDYSLDALLPQLSACRTQGKRIVLTNGCFDILHRGHITYLRQARALGDVLIVGLNTDESIQRLKGPERPINSLEDRAQVLAALNCVDHVVAFDEDTPHRLVQVIRPSVFVKGGDYTRDRLPEAALVEELGGRVEILPLVQERSTTGLITRIRSAAAPANGHEVQRPGATLLPEKHQSILGPAPPGPGRVPAAVKALS